MAYDFHASLAKKPCQRMVRPKLRIRAWSDEYIRPQLKFKKTTTICRQQKETINIVKHSAGPSRWQNKCHLSHTKRNECFCRWQIIAIIASCHWKSNLSRVCRHFVCKHHDISHRATCTCSTLLRKQAGRIRMRGGPTRKKSNHTLGVVRLLDSTSGQAVVRVMDSGQAGREADGVSPATSATLARHASVHRWTGQRASGETCGEAVPDCPSPRSQVCCTESRQWGVPDGGSSHFGSSAAIEQEKSVVEHPSTNAFVMIPARLSSVLVFLMLKTNLLVQNDLAPWFPWFSGQPLPELLEALTLVCRSRSGIISTGQTYCRQHAS